MRRPSFCCEQHGAGHTKCQPQEGGESTLSRVRRFLAVSMGGRSSSRCKHPHAIPPDPLHAPAHAVHSLLADMKGAGVGVQGILGRPLDEVMAAHGEDSNGHGVPTLVHLLCCFLLTHGVDYDTLVSEDWCAEEVRTRLLLEREAAGVDPEAQDAPPGSDSAVATGLLRLFLDELPHPLLPPDVAPLLLQLAADSGVGESGEGVCGGSSGEGRGGGGGGGGAAGRGQEGGVRDAAKEEPPPLCVAVVPRLRRLLHRRLPVHNLCLLRYLAAFIHQLRTGNHNTCPVPVDSLSRVLARVLIGREVKEPQGQSANRLGELIILCYNDIFQNTEEIVDDADDLSDSVSSPGSVGDSREDGLDDVDDDDEADTTTSDTDDFRSPPVSPLKMDNPRGSPGPSSPPPHQPSVSARLGEVGSSSSSRSSVCLAAWGSTSTIPGGGTDKNADEVPLDPASPVTFDPAEPVTQAPTATSDPVVSQDKQPLPESSQDSAKEALTDTPQDTVASRQDLHLPGLHRKRKEHADGKEGGEHDPKVIRSNKEVVGDLTSIRSKVPTYAKDFLESPSDSLVSPEDDDDDLLSTVDEDHTTQQDSGSQSQSTEEDKTPSYLTSLTSDDEPTRYDPVPPEVTPCELGLRSSQQRATSGFSELVDASEPVTSDRGSWSMRGAAHADPWHRTAPRYSRFDDEDSAIQSSWYRSDEDDTVVSPRASQAFIDTGAPPGRNDIPPPGQSAVKILMKNINSIKKKIKRYEEEFEAAFGYRPSHSEKMKHKEIKKYMSELSKARKELKQMKDDVAGLMSVPTVFPLSLLRCQESTNPGARSNGTGSGTASTLKHVEDRLREKRSALGRPAELNNMSCMEMQEEKTALQKALLYYESIHGRPTSREDRDLARPLYDRYRQVKRIVMRSSSRTKENLAELPPIIEHVAMDFTLASPQHRSSLQGDEIEKLIQTAPTTPPGFESPPMFDPSRTATTRKDDPKDDPKDGQQTVALGDLHALPLSELRERKKEAREEKKKLRRSLREYEEKFERELGRKVQKEDRGPMEQTYLDYKHAKAKLRLLEALLSKHEPLKV
ncbi:protein FAM13B isoform X3 [Procambarus clarkii]|uniref:protein FAM13B isoform X3 n=1 Tax=Procambarus clarkii TaxID=6728 RepID=UPI003741F3C8